MKNEINIPVLKKENLVAAQNRRNEYAKTRDLQALELNEAITKRLLSEAVKKVKCSKCGKEFPDPADAQDPLLCPECK